MTCTLHLGNCLDVLRTMPDNSVDAIVTDPPYGLAFMGKRWDYDVPSTEIWAECLRVLRPGGHLLAFAGTRTQHRMAVRIEDAGFEIRDMIAWVYGSGFPKSLDVSKAIDKAAGAEREAVSPNPNHRPDSGVQYEGVYRGGNTGSSNITAPATPEAQQWTGWSTALKPALEPITVARKPLGGTVAANVLQWGTGALNVDGCRVGATAGDEPLKWEHGRSMGFHGAKDRGPCKATTSPGRWPANLIHDGSDEVVEAFPETASHGSVSDSMRGIGFGSTALGSPQLACAPNSGSAARFFYCAKASRADREDGCDALPNRTAADRVERTDGAAGMDSPRAGAGRTSGGANHHPTVKPTDLMRYLCRLVTPPGGTVLDPFAGSGSTGRGAVLEGFAFVGIELDPEYLAIADARIAAAVRMRADEIAEADRAASAPRQLSLF
jgi:DNA modification methylase